MPVVINGTTGITNSGTEQVATTIGVGGATPSPSGAGITFPATQSPSTDANTLDDYEEGTWTPLIQNSTGTESVSLTGAGTYTKVGRFVFCQINTYNTNVSALTAGTHLFLRGLPFSAAYFAANSIFSNYPSALVSIVDGAATTAPMYIPSNAVDYTFFTRNTWGGSSNITLRGQFSFVV